MTSGATEAITASLMALIDPGDEVVLIEPLYDTYLPVVTMLGGIGRLVRLEPPHWTLPRAALEAAFGPRTKAIVLNSPMNPIGKVFTPEELGFIAGLMQKHDTYAVCDEVYEHLVFDGVRHRPLMTLPGMRERTLRIGSAGKTFSLTGWKVGYISGPAALMSVVAKAHQNLTFTTPPNLQRAVALGLAKDDAYFAGLAADLQAKRDHLVAGLQAAGFRTLPSGGSYFRPRRLLGARPGWRRRRLLHAAGGGGRRRRHSALGLLCRREAAPPCPLRLLQTDQRAG